MLWRVVNPCYWADLSTSHSLPRSSQRPPLDLNVPPAEEIEPDSEEVELRRHMEEHLFRRLRDKSPRNESRSAFPAGTGDRSIEKANDRTYDGIRSRSLGFLANAPI